MYSEGFLVLKCPYFLVKRHNRKCKILQYSLLYCLLKNISTQCALWPQALLLIFCGGFAPDLQLKYQLVGEF